MRHIKLRILTIIWSLIFLLFGVFEVILNTALPLYFEAQAKNALEYEVNYIKAIKDDANENAEDVEYVGTYFSGEINFIVLDEEKKAVASETNAYKGSQKINEKEVIDYQKNNDLEIGVCYTLKTENGYYTLVKYEDVFALYGESVPTIMYINIKPLLQYTKTLDVLLVFAFLCVTVLMSAIGYRLAAAIENSQESQRRFFQNSSHELKTPLMAIQGYAEGIQTGLFAQDVSSSIILEESERMTRLVDEILSISKIDAHRLALNKTTADVREILYDCLRAVEGIQQERGVEFALDFDSKPVLLSCDEDQLARVFGNVLVNALRHCDSKISVTCKSLGKYCLVKIRDDGEGLSDEDLPHIFDRFYTGKNGNTGIGLALAAEIIKLHKGSITAYNDEDGAVFEIKLKQNS